MKDPIIIVGGGFTGLAAAWDLSAAGLPVHLYESEPYLGGLAGTFELQPGIRIEKFYHHWFTNDTAVLDLAHELRIGPKLKRINSNTGLFHANEVFRLSSPIDLLKFPAISLLSRIRTGLMALRARGIKNWQPLEGETAENWIRRHGGDEAFRVMWQPLLRGKFGKEASEVSAVWFWNKLKLRGSSRGEKGKEQLIYLEGGFQSLIDELRAQLETRGVKFFLGEEVKQIISEERKVKGILTASGERSASAVLATVPLPVFLKLTPGLPPEYRHQASQIRFLGNTCLVLRLNRSLSTTYWLNVADPTFPFVGIIEHTNFDTPSNYGGERIAYLSKYLSTDDPLFHKSEQEFFEYAVPFLKRMFPDFSESWVNGMKLWRASYSQPVITKHYSQLIPAERTPIDGLWLSTMAQVYPEDRGTNYAVAYGRKVAKQMIAELRTAHA